MCLLLSPLAAFADIPTVGYLTDFYTNICKNPNLGLVDNGMPNAIPSIRYTLGVVDYLNRGQTTLAADLESDAIADVSYLEMAMSMLTDDAMCCPGGYVADDGRCTSCGTWLTESTDKCMAAGEYRQGDTCLPCPDGNICAAGTAGTSMCGAGYYCTDGVRRRCEYGRNQCPEQKHAVQPDIIACDKTSVFITVSSDTCTGHNEYRDGTSCTACPDGWFCPVGSNGKIMCGNGYWCANGERTACEYGRNQCPEYYHSTQPDTVACDYTWVFVE